MIYILIFQPYNKKMKQTSKQILFQISSSTGSYQFVFEIVMNSSGFSIKIVGINFKTFFNKMSKI